MAILTNIEAFEMLGITNPSAPDDANMTRAIAGAVRACERELGYKIEAAVHTEYHPGDQLNQRGDRFVDVQNDKVTLYGESGEDKIFLKFRPARNDGSLEVREQFGARGGMASGAWGASTVLEKGVAYWLDLIDGGSYSMTGILYRSGAWPSEPRSVKVTYNAGFTAAELAGTDLNLDAYDIKDAVQQETLRRFRQYKVNQYKPLTGFTPGQITSESLGGYSNSIGGNIAEVANAMEISASVRRMLAKWKSYGRVSR